MSSVAAPYGLRPVNLIGGQSFVGSTRLIKIASAYAANIFFGQPVKFAAGTIQAETGTTSISATGVAGIFVGCSYTDPTLKYKVFKQYWPTGTVTADAVAYVVDDPDIVMAVQADGTLAQSAIGKNIALTASAGSTSTGNATTAVSAASIATTNTLPLRVIGFVDSVDSAVGDAYTDILVKWNAPWDNAGTLTGGHAYLNSTGV